jgi:hypothetical protein
MDLWIGNFRHLPENIMSLSCFLFTVLSITVIILPRVLFSYMAGNNRGAVGECRGNCPDKDEDIEGQ